MYFVQRSTLAYVFCIGAGGRVFVMGTYLGLLASLVTTFFCINVYMGTSSKISSESPYFSVELAYFMDETIYDLYTRTYLIICILALIFTYICV